MTETVRLFQTTGTGESQLFAEVSLDANGQLHCTRHDLLEVWVDEGIVGRGDQGRLFPSDGARFLDELPFAYRSPYLWAEVKK